jgi:formylglycine-generating enzyme required for sulfatase activity/tetratricopeptide (TPR) repeat protein
MIGSLLYFDNEDALKITKTRDFNSLISLIKIAQNGSFVFVLYSNRESGDFLVGEINRRITHIPSHILHISQDRPNIRSHVMELPLFPKNTPVIIHVFDIESAFPDSARYLDLHREFLASHPFIILVWIKPESRPIVMRKSSHFFSRHSGVFDLCLPPHPPELPRGTILPDFISEKISGDERLRLIDFLEDMLISEGKEKNGKMQELFPPEKTKIHKRLGVLYFYATDFNKSHQHLEKACELITDLQDTKYLQESAEIFYMIARTQIMRHNHDSASDYLDKAMTLFEQMNDRQAMGYCLRVLGDIQFIKRSIEKAKSAYESALSHFKEINDRSGEANCLLGMGDIFLSLSNPEKSHELYSKALEYFHHDKMASGEANAFMGLGDVYFSRSEFEKAREYYKKALPLFQDMGDLIGESGCKRRLTQAKIRKRIVPDRTGKIKKAAFVKSIRDFLMRSIISFKDSMEFPGYSFLSGFFEGLSKSFGDSREEERHELARSLLSLDLSEIKREIRKAGVSDKKNIEIISQILKSIAQNTPLIDGFVPENKDLLIAVKRIGALPDEILMNLKQELPKIDEKLDRDVRKIKFEKAYLKAVKEEYGYLEILGIPSYAQQFPIDAGFITLSLKGNMEQNRIVSSHELLSRFPRLLITGPAGSGKTTLLQWETVRCCEEEEILKVGSGWYVGESVTIGQKNPWCGLIPFFIRLRRLVRHGGDFPAFPNENDWISLSIPHLNLKPPSDWLDSVLTDGRALLILDGLDELPPNKRPKFWKELNNLVTRRYPNLRFRISSRLFPHKGEKAPQWNPPKEPKTGNEIPTVEVLPLSPSKIDELIDQWYEAAIEAEPTKAAREKTRRELKGYPESLKQKLQEPRFRRILEMAETPFLCAAICLINRYKRKLIPEERNELYKLLIEALISLRDKEREIRISFPYDDIKVETLVRVHSHLALDMMTSVNAKDLTSTSYLIEAGKDDVLKWIDDCIKETPALKGNSDAQSLLEYILVRCGLLREPVNERYDFRHRGIQEYLAGSASMQLSKIDLLVSNAHDDRWRDTIILAAGGYNVGNPQAIDLINRLIDRGESEKKIIYFALAVACLETAKQKIDNKTNERAMLKLNKILPPQNSEDAKAISAAGDEAAKELSYEKYENKLDILAACAETLSLIGSEKAREQLQKGYITRPEFPIVLQLLKCPGIHPLEIPAVIGNAKESHFLNIPEFALEYIRDIKPISDIPNLLSIDLRDCYQLRDISPIEKCKNLNALILTGCGNVTTIESIKELSKLETLNLTDCVNITDFPPLSSLKRLKNLNMMDCGNLENLEPLSGLKNLASLSLRCCEKIGDISPISGLKNLKKLDLGYCIGIKDFSPLQELPNLKSLDLQGIEILKDFKLPKSIPSEPKSGIDFLEIAEGLYMKMVWIDGGDFLMGSPEGETGRYDDEGPVHRVHLDGFWMASVPVTQRQYQSIIKDNPSNFKGEYNPVEEVSWNDAREFCAKLSEKTRRNYSLPTEAQWEFACRAGSKGRFCFGDSDQLLEHYAWYDKNSENKTHPVGQKRPNQWGVFDMHGNVWEWCHDWYGEYREGEFRNPEGPENGEYRLLRGGSWVSESRRCRSACRYYGEPDHRYRNIGFRVVLVARTQKI